MPLCVGKEESFNLSEVEIRWIFSACNMLNMPIFITEHEVCEMGTGMTLCQGLS